MRALSLTQQDYYLSNSAVMCAGDVVVDIGAHVGVWSIYLAKRFPFITVYAIEPDSRHYASLVENIGLNELKNVIPIKAAVAGAEGLSRLYSDPLGNEWATINSRFAMEKHVMHVAETQTTDMAAFCREHGIDHLRIVKISAWGAVREILVSLPGSVQIDFLCGEVDLQDCSKPTLEAVSRRAARHFFWRTVRETAAGRSQSWVHCLPQSVEDRATGLRQHTAQDAVTSPVADPREPAAVCAP